MKRSRKLERLFAAPIKKPRRARLKPCPFDGAKAALLSEPKLRPRFPHRVWCTKCHASTAPCRLQAFAVRAWNMRAHDAAACSHEKAIAANR